MRMLISCLLQFSLKVMKIHKLFLILKIILYFRQKNKTKTQLLIIINVQKVILCTLISKVNLFLIHIRITTIKIYLICRKFKRLFKKMKIFLKKNSKKKYKKHQKNIRIHKEYKIVIRVDIVEEEIHQNKVIRNLVLIQDIKK